MNWQDWSVLTLGECCEVLNPQRKALNKAERLQCTGTIPYWGANGIIDHVDDYLFDEPLLLIPEDAGHFREAQTRPICHRIEGQHWVGNHTHVLRVKPPYNRDWFYTWLVHRDIMAYVYQGTRLKLNLSQLKQLPVAIPPVAEQTRLTGLFNGIEFWIQCQERRLCTCEQLKQALAQRHLTPQSDWPVRRLDDIATLKRGRFGARPRNNPRYFGGEMPFVQTADIARTDGVLRHYRQTLNPTGVAVSKVFPKGTLLMTIAGHIAKVAITTFDTACPDSLIGIQAHSGIHPRWLCEVLRAQKTELSQLATQSAQKNLNLNSIKPFLVAVPPEAVQKRLADVFSHIETYRYILKQQQAMTQRLKQGLRDDLLRYPCVEAVSA